MSNAKQIDCFLFATEDTYETAKREKIVIEKIRKKYDVRNKQVALKIYRKAVKDNSFSTLVGYAFLEELYHNMEIAGVNVEELPPAVSILFDNPLLRNNDRQRPSQLESFSYFRPHP